MPVPPPISNIGARARSIGELPQRSFDRQQRALRRIVEQRRREFAAGDLAHMQLQQSRVVRRRGNGKAAPPAARQHDVDVLAGLEAEVFGRGQPQEQAHDVVRQGHAALDAAGSRLMRICSGVLISNVSMERSLSARAWHSSTNPSALSASDKPSGGPLG